MGKRHYILYVLIIAITSSITTLKAQTFVEAAYGRTLYEYADFDDFTTRMEGGNFLNFQIGKFVNNKVARTFSIGYHTGMSSRDTVTTFELGGQPRTFGTKFSNVGLSIFDIAYERKKTIAHTEFDDTWNIYSIKGIGLSFHSFKEEVILETKPGVQEYNDKILYRSSITYNFTFGWGFARKVTMKSYVYGDLRSTINGFPEAGFFRFPVILNFGYRQFL